MNNPELYVQINCDKDTYNHSRQVKLITEHIADSLDCDIKTTELLKNAAVLHDVGKCYIPKQVLDLKRKLKPTEQIVVDMHAYYGYTRLMNINEDRTVCELVLLHHGFNKTIAKKLIPKDISDIAKQNYDIIMAADIYAAVTTKRKYHEPVMHEKAINIVKGYPEIRKDVIDALEAYTISFNESQAL